MSKETSPPSTGATGPVYNAFQGAIFHGKVQAIGVSNGPVTQYNYDTKPSKATEEEDSSDRGSADLRVFVFIAKGHEEESLTSEALKILDWKLDPERSIGGFETWSKQGKRGKTILVDLFTAGCTGEDAVNLVTQEVVKDHKIFTTIGCCGGLPELPLGTVVPILSASVEGRIIEREPHDYMGLDRITDNYIAQSKGHLAGPLVRTGQDDGALVGDVGTPKFKDDLLKKPRVLTTTEIDLGDGTTDFSKKKLSTLLRKKNCAVVEMEIGLYWARLQGFSRAKEFRILPAFKGVSDNGYPDDITDEEHGRRASTDIRKANRRFATKSASLAMLLYLEQCL